MVTFSSALTLKPVTEMVPQEELNDLKQLDDMKLGEEEDDY